MSEKDVTGVFDSKFNQVFSLARPMKVAVLEDAKAMQHPLETGATVTDHVIINPVSIELTLFLTGDEYKATYEQIKTLFKAVELLTVTTKTGSYPSMFISGIPHEETSDMFDVVPMTMKLEEARFFKMTYQPGKMKKHSNKPVVKAGEKAPKQSVLYKIFH